MAGIHHQTHGYDQVSALSELLKHKEPLEILIQLSKKLGVHPEFILQGEHGPSHSKEFTFHLVLTKDQINETYIATDKSIKKTKHTVSLAALSKSPLFETSLIFMAGKLSVPSVTKKNTKMKNTKTMNLCPPVKEDISPSPEPDDLLSVLQPNFPNHQIAACPRPLDQCLKEKVDVNVVLEFAIKLHLPVDFHLVGTEGPPHERIFTVACILDQRWSVKGIGSSMKLAKHNAAQKFIEYFRNGGRNDAKLHALLHRTPHYENGKEESKKKSRFKFQEVVKQQKAELHYGHLIQPVCRLIQICQAKNIPEPIFQDYRFAKPNFWVQCSLPQVPPDTIPMGDSSCEVRQDAETGFTSWTSLGMAKNKKLAKRFAAEAMLECLGYPIIVASFLPKKSLRKTQNEDDLLLQLSSVSVPSKPASQGSKVLIDEHEKREVFEVSRHLVKGDRRFRKLSSNSSSSASYHKRRHHSSHHPPSVSQPTRQRLRSSSTSKASMSAQFGCWKGEAAESLAVETAWLTEEENMAERISMWCTQQSWTVT